MSNPSTQATTEILLSLGTAPLLLILVGSRALASMMKEMGQTSEELFRGDRLPILKISSTSLAEQSRMVK